MRNYKLAKVFSKDLETIVREVELSIAKLSPYVRYKPVAKVLGTLKNELIVLKIHQKECSNIVTTKGQVRPEGDIDGKSKK